MILIVRFAHLTVEALKQWDPFAPDTSLRGLINGITADESVNADKAHQIGQNVLESMVVLEFVC